MATFHAKALELALEALLATGTPKLAFMATTFVPDAETDQYWSDISAEIASGTTLRTLTGVVVNIDTANDRVTIDFNNPSETPVTASTNKCSLIVDTGNPATSPVLITADITPTLSPVGGTLTLTVNALGLGGINY
jgi:hypothetical protein